MKEFNFFFIVKHELISNHWIWFQGDEDKKASSKKDEKIKSENSSDPLTVNKGKNIEILTSSESEKTQNSSR